MPARHGLPVLLACMLAACGGDPPAPATGVPAAPRHATVRAGDVTVRANALPTADLDEAVAERYGITRRPGDILLVVGVRRGQGAEETPMRADVRATVTDLRGQRRPVELRELHGHGPDGEPLLDHFAVVGATAPDTLRFDIAVDWPRGAGVSLRLEHELAPD